MPLPTLSAQRGENRVIRKRLPCRHYRGARHRADNLQSCHRSTMAFFALGNLTLGTLPKRRAIVSRGFVAVAAAVSAAKLQRQAYRLRRSVATALCAVTNPLFSSSLLLMHFLEPVRVTLFESLLPSLQPACWRRISELVIARSLLLEIFLSNHVQLRVGRQLCVARRLLSGFLPDFISRPFLRCSTVSSAMSKEHRHAAHDDPR